jgi:Family of unknown function (DUF6152)
MTMHSALRALVALLGFVAATTAAAHHSYAMFDGTRTLKVAGTVAKIEWTNPHVFVWVYVPNAERESGYDLYAFENGSPNVLERLGWSKTLFAVNEMVTIEYWPLFDGRTGGHFALATRADGSVVRGAGGPQTRPSRPARAP